MPFQSFLPASTRLYLGPILLLDASLDLVLDQIAVGQALISRLIFRRAEASLGPLPGP